MANRLSIKDPSCLLVTIIPWTAQAAIEISVGGFDVNGNIALEFGGAVNIQGVFAEDGDYAMLESTQEEDEFTESADGSVCVFTKPRNSEILTLRLNSCNDTVNQLIELKDRSATNIGGVGGANNVVGVGGGIRVPWQVTVYELCTGEIYQSQCAWMLSNPTRSFGDDDSPIEVRILMTEVQGNRGAGSARITASLADFQANAQSSLNAILQN